MGKHEKKDVIPVTVVNIQWRRIPENIREEILGNVWCSNCRNVVSIADYQIQNDKLGLIISGKCSVCGSEVARVLETE